MTPEILNDWLRSVLKPLGFIKQKSQWFLVNSETVVVVALQKSDYGEKYYVNLGVWLRRLGDDAFPNERHCHIRTRLTALVPGEERDDVERAFDLDNIGTRDDEPNELLGRAASILEDFACSASSMKGLRDLYRSGRLSAALIHQDAKVVLAA